MSDEDKRPEYPRDLTNAGAAIEVPKGLPPYLRRLHRRQMQAIRAQRDQEDNDDKH